MKAYQDDVDNRSHRRQFRVIVIVAALALAGCNANQTVNSSGQTNRCANDTSCNPYNPSSYAQNNTGNRNGGSR
jgi:hypothetical protein